MQTIWKYTLSLETQQTRDIPPDAAFLSAQLQAGGIQLWYRIPDDSRATEPRQFKLHGTSNEAIVDATDIYRGTVQLRGGTLVMHVFECLPALPATPNA